MKFYLRQCIQSLSNQSFKNFEVIVVDDASKEAVAPSIKQFNDLRIECIRLNDSRGIPYCRNTGIKYAKGNIIFFTDADCVVDRNWIAQGLLSLEEEDVVGVEGKTYYVSEKYNPTFSDHICENKYGGQYMTGNIAYKKDILIQMKGFDEKYSYFEDRDLALRILKRNKRIVFNHKMIAYAQKQKLTPNELLKRSHILKNRAYLFKRFKDKACVSWRIINPLSLAKILFPPITFVSLIFNKDKFKSKEDFNILPFTYLADLLARFELWRICAEERIFLI